jgi:hypothetical protein
VLSYHPSAATLYRTLGLPALALAYTGIGEQKHLCCMFALCTWLSRPLYRVWCLSLAALTTPLNLYLQLFCAVALGLVHAVMGQFGPKPGQTYAALLPLPGILFIV